MRPIESFNFYANPKEQLSYLQYLKRLVQLYIPSRYESSECPSPAFIINPNAKPADENQPVTGLPESLTIFVERYNQRAFPNFLDYDSYANNQTIQELISYLGINKDKFWFTLLFIYDYSLNQCLNGNKMKESVEEQVTNLLAKVDEYTESSKERPFTLTFSTGKKKTDVVIDNDLALDFITEAIKDKLKTFPLADYYDTCHHEMSDEIVEVPNSVYITYFANMFLTVFDLIPEVTSKRKKGAKHSQKEKDLVCQLIYFCHLSREKSWLEVENENLKGYLRQYTRSVDTFNAIYPIFDL